VSPSVDCEGLRPGYSVFCLSCEVVEGRGRWMARYIRLACSSQVRKLSVRWISFARHSGLDSIMLATCDLVAGVVVAPTCVDLRVLWI
jgi:hypothetical protein